ncbi:ricin-type beta-trefoil lectin domain protein [Streptomyces sp. PSKA54]|uniref:Ricin-type beta-trefoil lectin domain protein n=1 Tax=Streptomyces himalayensis subsp. aureolus TaxID=2758039 RepID=A0A7W2HJR2_9ACTN|nr:RICIN domain-containing protein [Streptomyces himalayensis]MBA4866387.1 ricin-type beta-trefoil lectin domain protein [Streptomyces himalayensis subsp. aureolus]
MQSAVQGVHAQAPDVQLTDLLRANASTAYPALRELRRRHRPAVLGYARLCGIGENSARQLTAQAFALAAHEVKQGAEPRGTWRHHLLLHVLRVARAWAADARCGRLAPGLLARLDATAAMATAPDGLFGREAAPAHPGGPTGLADPVMVAAFQSLPLRLQGIIWYGVVEEEPDPNTAVYVGASSDEVAQLKESALNAMRRAWLNSHLTHCGDTRCRGYGRLIEEAVRPGYARHSPDLHAHLADCACCSTAYAELTGLRDSPREVLADGLLGWGGAEYAGRGGAFAGGGGTACGVGGAFGRSRRAGRAEADAHARSGTNAEAAGPKSVHPGTYTAAAGSDEAADWWPSRRLVLVSVAVGVALAPLLVLLLSTDSEPAGRGAMLPPQQPPVTVTATATVSASPAPTMSAKPTKSAKPSERPAPPPPPSPSPSRTKSPAPPPPGAHFTQFVNAASGLCLDLPPHAYPQNGTDVVTAPCSSSPTQRWRVDADRGVIQSYAAPAYCLDSRGDVDKTIGIWTCSSVDGPNGLNLTFTVDTHGTIHPAIAPDHAVTPYSEAPGSLLAQLPSAGRADQRWTAGTAPA